MKDSSKSVALDQIDLRILNRLQQDGRTTNQELAEAVGLSRSLCREYFPGLITRISGIGQSGIQKRVEELHGRGFGEGEPPLAIGGFYRYRRGGESHAYEARLIRKA